MKTFVLIISETNNGRKKNTFKQNKCTLH